MNSNLIEVGDMIAIRRFGYKHVGIYVGFQGVDGTCVVHNCKRKGVMLSTLNDFSGNSRVFILHKAVGNFYEREIVAQRAMSLLGKNYDLIKFNCEHAAFYAQSGVVQSPQIAIAVLLSLFVILLAFFARKKA